ncbi:tudor domain-containing 6-like [Galleria mellonella]|uniref:Tudor domain-containing 6-like n=1 Tax=Galleria mellonella TaxID=7137 RepID=A0ABM3N6W8_GALME|nr:tudor domain-containing 6-like [Galleria mellonella]
MSFVDLATLTFHRRNELEARINIFVEKSEHAISEIKKLQVQAQEFVQKLNCEPAELKERFLSCMKQLDEYTYLITDFNLCVKKLEENSIVEYTPVLDTMRSSLPTPTPQALNLMDVLSEPMPSTSTACPNLCPSEKPAQENRRKGEQPLIEFSSTSCSSESVPVHKNEDKEVQCEVATELNKLSLNATPFSGEQYNLPAQTVLQCDVLYSSCTIISVDGLALWIITDDIDEVCTLMNEMTDYYKKQRVVLTPDQIRTLHYCAFYDEESNGYYRGFFIKLTENMVEVFLVDTGEMRTASIACIQPLMAQFCDKPPYARCCHLAGLDLLGNEDEELMIKQEEFLKKYIGQQCQIEVDDNTSESLGVYVILSSNKTINELMVKQGLASMIDKRTVSQANDGAPRSVDSELDITQCPEYEDAVEAVTGYHNRDEADICKHYKGGPEKTCFKGSRCNKRHIMKHPDGWTLDRVQVFTHKPCPLPPPGTWHKVLVTYVCHFNRFYVQFINEKKKEEPLPEFGIVLPPTSLEALVRDMNSPATRMAYKRPKTTPAPGELVAALYPPDDQWYRARVRFSSRADQNVEVMYVDYGNMVWVKEDCVRMLDPRFVALPAQAARCSLAGVVAREQTSRQWAATKTALANLVQDRTFDAHVISRDYDEITVELYDEDDYSVAEHLAALNMVTLEEYTVFDDTNVTQKLVVP